MSVDYYKLILWSPPIEVRCAYLNLILKVKSGPPGDNDLGQSQNNTGNCSFNQKCQGKLGFVNLSHIQNISRPGGINS